MCVMNLRRKSLRIRSTKSKVISPPNVKISKRKSTNRSRVSSKIIKLDDLENSFGKTNVDIAKNFRACKPLLSRKRSKHSSRKKYELCLDSYKDPLASNSFSSSIKHQSATSVRKRKSTQQNYSTRNVSQVKKRKKNKSSTKGKEVFNSSGVSNESSCSSDGYLDTLRLETTTNTNLKRITNRHSLRISDKNVTKSNERSIDHLTSETITRVSPRLAARKKIENKENEGNNINHKDGQVSPSANKLNDSNNSNNSSSKTRVKRSKNVKTSPTNSEVSEKSTDETSSYSKYDSDDTLSQDKQTRKRDLKTVSNQKHLKQNSHQNLSRYSLRFSGNKTSIPNAYSIEVASDNTSSVPSKSTRSALRSSMKPNTCSSKRQHQTTKATIAKCHLRRHTVPVQKTKKNWRTNSKNKINCTVNLQTPSNVDAQIGEFSCYLNNIPTDDINKIPFYSPNNVKMFRQSLSQKQGIIITSTPDLKKATKHQQAKKRGKKLDDSCGSSKKSIPCKGSLKRKRLLINSLKEKNEGYEDDIFENCSFGSFKNVLELDDDSDTSTSSIATPKCPFLVTSSLPAKTPRFKDCYSPFELLKARKVAEEYMYRRNKKWKNSLHSTPYLKKKDSLEPKTDEKILGSTASVPSEKMKLDFMSVIEQYKRKCELVKDKESDEDEYFSDVSS